MFEIVINLPRGFWTHVPQGSLGGTCAHKRQEGASLLLTATHTTTMGDCVGKPNSRRNSVVPLTESDDMELPENDVHQTWCTSTSSYTKTDSGTDGQTLDTTCRESQPRPYNRSDRYLVRQTEMEAAASTSTDAEEGLA